VNNVRQAIEEEDAIPFELNVLEVCVYLCTCACACASVCGLRALPPKNPSCRRSRGVPLLYLDLA